jgi:hypothetical protein
VTVRAKPVLGTRRADVTVELPTLQISDGGTRTTRIMLLRYAR